jgi:hypothetical protein
MADTNPNTTLTYETLTELSARLTGHADAITNAARQDIAADLRMAAAAVGKLADLQVRVIEIAGMVPNQAPAVTARDLRQALTGAEALEGR